METYQETDLDYRQVIQIELEHRQRRNSSYSLRSYARDLNISPSRLSEILNKKGELSPQTLMDVGHRLGIPTQEVLALKAKLELKTSNSEEVKKSAEKYLANYHYQNRFQLLTEDSFKILADWYHFAILSAMEMNFFDGTPAYLARVLRLDTETVEESLKRMLDHKMVHLIDGKYKPTGEIFSTTNDISSVALKEAHRQTLDQAKAALYEIDVDLRDITSSTICIDMDRLPEAKKMIREFRRGLSRFLESGKKNAVYNINIQLHPLSEIEHDQLQ